jgi:hypothetical protein
MCCEKYHIMEMFLHFVIGVYMEKRFITIALRKTYTASSVFKATVSIGVKNTEFKVII